MIASLVMVIDRRRPRYPRRGPSCMLVLVFVLGAVFGMYIIGNAEEVRDAIIPTPTMEPTRSATEFATSAALYERDGELENAISAYEEAIALEPNKIEFYMPLIQLLTQTGQAEPALEWAEKAKVLAADNDNVWAAVSSAHIANADRLSETGDPASADLQFTEAINAANKAIELNPENAEAYAYMATALSRLGLERIAEAQEKAAWAVELAPDSPVTRRAMANVFEQLGQYDNAINEYMIALDYNPNSTDLRIDLAYLFFFTERRQEAILTLQEVTELDPSNADAFDGLGYFYFVLGQYPRAEESAYEAVMLDPEMTRAHAHLGAAYFKQFKYDSAIEELETATEAYGEISQANSTYFNMLGLAYYYQSLCDNALPIFEEVLLSVEPGSIPETNAQEGMELCRQAQIGGTGQ